MSGISTENSSGKKIDVDLNLVPFIDLLSTLILFLLLTIVWTQVAAVPASVDSKGKAKTADVTPNKIIVTVTSSGLQVSWPQTLASHKLPQNFNKIENIIPVLKKIVAEVKTQGKIQNKIYSATVVGQDSVEYGTVIKALDAVKESGIVMVGLSTD